MENNFLNLTINNIEKEHLCCAIADKKHQAGVRIKREWLSERIKEGHTFRKLHEKGKVFIEYAPLETAWVPVEGKNFIYIYCLWVSGSFKGKGYGRELLRYCLDEAREQGKSGVCIISSKKKKPFLSDGKFMKKFGFITVDTIGDEYELLSLSFDGTEPKFIENAKKQKNDSDILTIYYSFQCPYIQNCIEEIKEYCCTNNIHFNLILVDTLEKAKNVPGVFNNWAVFYNGKFETVHLLNKSYLMKLIAK